MKHVASLAFILLLSEAALGWNSVGHDVSVQIAFELRPDLREKCIEVLKALPQSRRWIEIRDSGFAERAWMLDKRDPNGWVRDIHKRPAYASNFPDWIRDYNGSSKYSADHYDDLAFETGKPIAEGNARRALDFYLTELSSMTEAGERAWALTWVMHLVGDLHQPLHTTARLLPNGKYDRGGNDEQHGEKNLHAYWDDIFNPVAKDPGSYAKGKVAAMALWSSDKRSEFDRKRKDLASGTWMIEGHANITSIGYPRDGKVTNYDKAALAMAEYQILLAGARLADVLSQKL